MSQLSIMLKRLILFSAVKKFQIGSVTNFLKEDNTKIFSHLEEMMQQRRVVAVAQETEGSGEAPVEPKSPEGSGTQETESEQATVVFSSSAASKEQELFMQQQMEMNKKFLKKLGNAKLPKSISQEIFRKTKRTYQGTPRKVRLKKQRRDRWSYWISDYSSSRAGASRRTIEKWES